MTNQTISDFIFAPSNELLEFMLNQQSGSHATTTFLPEVSDFLIENLSRGRQDIMEKLCSTVWHMKHSEQTYSFVEAYVNFISDSKNLADERNPDIDLDPAIFTIHPEAIDGIHWASSFQRYAPRVWNLLRVNKMVFQEFVIENGLEKLMSHPTDSTTLKTAILSLGENMQHEFEENLRIEQRCANAGVIEMCLVALHFDDITTQDALNTIFNICVDPIVRRNCNDLVSPIMSKFCHPDAVAFNKKN